MWPFRRKKPTTSLEKLAEVFSDMPTLQARLEQAEKNMICQRCSSKNVKRIMYVPATDDKYLLAMKKLGAEIPQFDTEKLAGKYHVITGRPNMPLQWHCDDCNHEWNDSSGTDSLFSR